MIRAGRKTVQLRMPMKGALLLQTLVSVEPIGTTTPRAAPERRHSSSSELERWVQCGRADDHGPTAFKLPLDGTLTRDPEEARLGLDQTCEPIVANDPAQNNEPERDGDSRKGHLALVAAIDNICERRTRTRPAKSRGRRVANVSDAPIRLAPIAEIAPPQHAAATSDRAPEETAPTVSVDIELLSRNFVRLIEQGGKAMAACLRPREEGRLAGEVSDVVGIARTLGHIAEYWLAHPQRPRGPMPAISKTFETIGTANSASRKAISRVSASATCWCRPRRGGAASARRSSIMRWDMPSSRAFGSSLHSFWNATNGASTS